MTILINVKDEEHEFIMKLLQNFDFVQVQELDDVLIPVGNKQDIVDAFQEVKLHLQGKKKLQTAKEFLDEL